MEFVTCPQCDNRVEFANKLSFRAECDACAADVHVCLSCRFYDPYADNQCREPVAEPVAKKDRSNLCEYWKPPEPADAPDRDATQDAKAKLAALFGEKVEAPSSTTPSTKEDALKKLNDLFNKP